MVIGLGKCLDVSGRGILASKDRRKMVSNVCLHGAWGGHLGRYDCKPMPIWGFDCVAWMI